MTTVSSDTSDDSFAIVTPSYFPDLVRCEVLAESLDRCAPKVPHYLIVDRCDWRRFRHLEGGRRRLIESEALVGKWARRLPGRKSLWLSFKALPVRGWIMQQILKISAMDMISERTLVFCDSDTAFFRHFDRDNLLVNGKIGLLDVEYNENSIPWTIAARRVLRIPHTDGGYRNHVGNMICWNRETVRAMRQRIESNTGLNWQIALARSPSFSEYMIYGVFVREILGYDAVDQAPSTVPLVKPSWGISLSSNEELAAFFSDFDSRTVAVMIHSKDRIDPSRYLPYLEAQWRAVN